ncbi:hypothetical protein EPUL_002410 [Erysiphe pulchra]|uniref:BHLH domain-containing protein n=1 Tax=Erysiphe pulchra TaxID=225359 RepID=A0A2S4PY63_9PEZI|nr:hypothetical protein EPUL_002410 [Erysiphe pulchra]
MSDMDLEHHRLQEVANAMRGEESHIVNVPKRKRDPDSIEETRRSIKRVSPNVTIKEQQDNVQALQDYNSLQHGHLDSHNGSTEHSSTAAAAAAMAGIYPQMTVPQQTEVSFATQGPDMDRNQESSYMDNSQQGQESFMENQNPSGDRGSNSKPAVGSEEWHKVRKDNHKEGLLSIGFGNSRHINVYLVERRRRETINEGINELAKIVPGCEKNKGSILQRAVQFITELKEIEAQNIEKWTLEKLLTEQAIAELSASNDKLKTECDRAWREVETWKKTCQSAGLAPKKEDGMNV